MPSAMRRCASYSQRSGKSRYSKRRRCCMSSSVQRPRTRSVSPTIFSGRFPKVSGSMFNSTHETSVAQIHDHSFDTRRVFATIELQDVLYLQLRGTKAPTLSETACEIPALNKEARSVNHACTLLSAAIEQHRISHSTTCSGQRTSLDTQIAYVPWTM